MYSSTTEGISAGANAWRSISLCIGIRTGSDMSARRALTRPGGLRPRGPPTPSLAGPHDPRSAPAGAPVARLARYAARPQRVQNSRCEPHNGLKTVPYKLQTSLDMRNNLDQGPVDTAWAVPYR